MTTTKGRRNFKFSYCDGGGLSSVALNASKDIWKYRDLPLQHCAWAKSAARASESLIHSSSSSISCHRRRFLIHLTERISNVKARTTQNEEIENFTLCHVLMESSAVILWSFFLPTILARSPFRLWNSRKEQRTTQKSLFPSFMFHVLVPPCHPSPHCRNYFCAAVYCLTGNSLSSLIKKKKKLKTMPLLSHVRWGRKWKKICVIFNC